ncbi:MAG: ATP-binding protein [Rhodoferax sp.]|nr:ATP-binding protein [Rhodoferax sp.]
MAHSHNFSEQLASFVSGVTPLTQALGERKADCPEHGIFIASGVRYMGKREVWTGCQDCKEAQAAAELQAEAQQKAQAARQRIEAMLEDAAVPARFIGRTFDNFNAATQAQQAAKQAVESYANDFAGHLKRGTGLILSGVPGTGKSHLAAAALQAIMPAHCGLYTTCMNVIRTVRGTWRRDSDKSEAQVLNLLGTVPLLVLDEIGVQYGTDGEQTILFDVLDRRYRDMMPTILLTNQDKDGFKQFIGERSFDRLTESCRWVAFDWASYRATARKEAA